MAVSAGVVCAASYEARAWGVSAGMNQQLAQRLCPPLLCIPLDSDAIERASDDLLPPNSPVPMQLPLP